MNDFHIFTVAHGEKHRGLLLNALFPSLLAPDNSLFMKHATWKIFSDVPFTVSESLVRTVDNIKFQNTKRHLLEEIVFCARNNIPLLMAPPDTIFSDGALRSLLSFAESPAHSGAGSCVGFAHVRVTPKFLDGPWNAPSYEAHHLVEQAWRHLHRSWSEADASQPLTNSYSGGVSWREIGQKLIAVQHRLPTIYLANFLEEDFEFFASHQFSDWDHTWPSELIPKERYRYIGSSDAAFAVEVTEENSNVPTSMLTDPFERDAFSRHQLHNRVNRQFVSILRRG